MDDHEKIARIEEQLREARKLVSALQRELEEAQVQLSKVDQSRRKPGPAETKPLPEEAMETKG